MPLSFDERWRSCLDEIGPKLLLYARQWITSRADAEDVVQAAFIRFWQKHPDAHETDRPLLFAAVRSAALDLLRRENRRIRREEHFMNDPARAEFSFFSTALAEQEEAELTTSALQQLPEAQRETIVLRIWGELTFQQIATITGESINTVAARYRYGIEALRRSLSKHEYDRIGT